MKNKIYLLFQTVLLQGELILDAEKPAVKIKPQVVVLNLLDNKGV